jgi:hypothetical protein
MINYSIRGKSLIKLSRKNKRVLIWSSLSCSRHTNMISDISILVHGGIDLSISLIGGKLPFSTDRRESHHRELDRISKQEIRKIISTIKRYTHNTHLSPRQASISLAPIPIKRMKPPNGTSKDIHETRSGMICR